MYAGYVGRCARAPAELRHDPAPWTAGTAKRVSWVELYLDVVFVLAVGQIAHLLVEEPEWRSVAIALGLFMTVWWTWIGFAVLYNRRGEDEPWQRLLFLAGSVPAGVAAVALGPASHGDVTPLAISLALVRLVLSGANAASPDVVSRSLADLVSATLFAVSIAVPEPYRYLVWAIAIAGESGSCSTRIARRCAARGRSATGTSSSPPTRTRRSTRTTSRSASGCS